MAVMNMGPGGIQLPVYYNQALFMKSARGITRRMGGFSRQMVAQARMVQGALQFTFVFAGAHQLVNINRVFRNFDHLMYSVQAKVGATDVRMAQLETTIKRVAASSTKTAVQVGEAAEKFALLGFNADQIEAALQSTINASVATGTSIDDIAYTAGSVSRAINRTFRDVNDLLVATATNSGTTIEEMAVGLKYAQASFRGLGLSAEEAFLLIGKLANVGVRGSVMGTAFRSGLAALARDLKNLSDASTWSDLEKQLSKQADTLRKHGILLKKDEFGNITNFKEMLDILVKNKASTADFISILGTRSGSYFAALANATGSSSAKLEAAIATYEGTAQKVKAQMEQSLKSQWELSLAKWEDLQLAISESGLSDAEMNFVRHLQGALIWLKENLDQILPVAIKVGIAMGATGLVLTFSLLAQAVLFALSPLWKIPLAMAAIVINSAAWVASLFRMKGGFRKLGTSIMKTFLVVGLLAGGLATLYMIMSDDLPQDKLNREIKVLTGTLNGYLWKLEQLEEQLRKLRIERGKGHKNAWKRVEQEAAVNDKRLEITLLKDHIEVARLQLRDLENQYAVMDASGGVLTFSQRLANSVESVLDSMLGNLDAHIDVLLEKWDEVSAVLLRKQRIDSATPYTNEMVNISRNPWSVMGISPTGEALNDDGTVDEFANRAEPGSKWDTDKIKTYTSEVSSEMSDLVTVFDDVRKGSEFMTAGIIQGFKLTAEANAENSKRMAKRAKELAYATTVWNTAKAVMAIWGHSFAPGEAVGDPIVRKVLTGFVIGLGAAQLRKIKSTNYGGQAHDGLTEVPRTGTFVLEKGERVIKRSQNEDLKAFMESGAAQRPPQLVMPPGQRRLVYEDEDVEELNGRLMELWDRRPYFMPNGVVA